MSIALVENGQRVKRKKSQGVNVESDQEDKKTVSSKVKKTMRSHPTVKERNSKKSRRKEREEKTTRSRVGAQKEVVVKSIRKS